MVAERSRFAVPQKIRLNHAVKRIVILALPTIAALGLLSGCGAGKPAPAKNAAATDGPSTPSSTGAYDTSTLQSGGLDISEGAGATGSGAGGGAGSGDGGGPSAKATGSGSKSSPFTSGAAEVVRTAVAVADYHNLFTQAVAAKYRPVWLDGYDVGAAAFFNVVFRKDNGATPWFEYTEMSASGYQTRFDSLKGQGYQLTFVESYLNGGHARYAAIWEKSTGTASYAFHGFSASAYQSMLDKQTKAGFLPAQVSAIGMGGGLSYSGLLVKRSRSTTWVHKTVLQEKDKSHLVVHQT
jgi:hypothetical protein